MSNMTVKEWPKLPCRWTHDEDSGIWNTACGEAHLFEDGGPAENQHRFCPYCGGELVHGTRGVDVGVVIDKALANRTHPEKPPQGNMTAEWPARGVGGCDD